MITHITDELIGKVIRRPEFGGVYFCKVVLTQRNSYVEGTFVFLKNGDAGVGHKTGRFYLSSRVPMYLTNLTELP